MWFTDDIASCFRTIAGYFRSVSNAADGIPLIGGVLSSPFRSIAGYFDSIAYDFWWVGYVLGVCWDKVWTILSWDQIRANILGSWSWLNTIDDKIWWRAYSMVGTYWPWLSSPASYVWSGIYSNILGTWSWLNTAPDSIWSWVYPRIASQWSWLNSIDDRIRSTALAQWSWLNSIDDRIRTLSWDHIAPKLGDWLLAWLLLNLTIWGRIGYRILDKVWNMEWDDTRKEVK